jgi:hypothetical protein
LAKIKAKLPMQKKTFEITRRVHENLWTVLSFIFGRPAIDRFMQQKNFVGEWKYLRQNIHGLSEERADRALLDMAVQLRTLDDAEGLSDWYRQSEASALGHVIQADGTKTDLHFRDMTNKIIHGVGYQWQLEGDDPKIIVLSNRPDRWRLAEIDIQALMVLVGGLMF